MFPRHLAPVDQDASSGRHSEVIDASHERRLTGAAWSQDDKEFAAVKRKAYVMHGDDLAAGKALANAFESYDGLRHAGACQALGPLWLLRRVECGAHGLIPAGHFTMLLRTSAEA